jgi:Uma2 family endonuclease
MGSPDIELMSADAFLEWVDSQNERHELVNGVCIRMMAGANQSHALVTSNILVSLAQQARRQGCRTTSADTAVRTRPNGIRYPDLVVDCGPYDPTSREATRPLLVVEVLSPSTSSFDITDKLDEYRGLESLRLIVFVDPDVVAVKVYRRSAGSDWQVERYDDLAQSINLDEVAAQLALADIYAAVSPRPRPPLRVV